MLFNSFDFAVFFAVVLALYWVLPHRAQNLMLLAASYFFYGCWDWRFLGLIAFTTLANYVAGLEMGRASGPDAASLRRRKLWLWIGVAASLAPLAVFKYFNFFTESLTELLSLLGIDAGSLHLSLLLPVGISFYTFQVMTYTIDVYRNELAPTRRLADFALFVAFFPQLLAGPIGRARQLLPQIFGKRRFTLGQFLEGAHLMFWGLFKKIYVADNLARLVDPIFAAGHSPTGFESAFGVLAFTLQIYADFSGYSDIARGAAKCLGFELMLNFDLPYAAKNPREFWQRWHISLSSWLRDYLYIPLGGNRHGKWNTYRNLAITMLLGGLWHGAAWHFVLWGGYHGALLIGHRVAAPFLATLLPEGASLRNRLWSSARILLMFAAACFGWLLFRAASVSQIAGMTMRALTLQGAADWPLVQAILLYAGPLVAVEIVQYLVSQHDLERLAWAPSYAKSALYGAFFYVMAFYGASAQSFIYFQF